MAADQVTLSIQHAQQTTNALQIVSSAAPVINSDLYGSVKFTAQAVAITSVTVTGTPQDLQVLVFRFKDDGSARAITFTAGQFEPVGAALPTTTTAGKRSTVTFRYDATTNKWGCLSNVIEA